MRWFEKYSEEMPPTNPIGPAAQREQIRQERDQRQAFIDAYKAFRQESTPQSMDPITDVYDTIEEEPLTQEPLTEDPETAKLSAPPPAEEQTEEPSEIIDGTIQSLQTVVGFLNGGKIEEAKHYLAKAIENLELARGASEEMQNSMRDIQEEFMKSFASAKEKLLK